MSAVHGSLGSFTFPNHLLNLRFRHFIFQRVIYTLLLLALHSDQLYPVAICQFVIVDVWADTPPTFLAFILREYNFDSFL